MEKDLLDRLEEYCGKNYVPMHMPGGKRNTAKFQMPNPYEIDITEIDGFDNLHHADGILKEGFRRTAELFGAEESLWLINGSTVGLLAAICGTTKKNDMVLAARNCHRAVYNAIYLMELNPVYLYPEEYSCGIYGKILPEQVEEQLLQNKNISVVIITSPTYEGIVSDIKKIAEIVHKYDRILIVDEAHGAHFAFHGEFPESAVTCGADAVIQSIHKTLPAFTQTALLHLQGKRICREKIKKYWDIFQTTSPSYVLMAGIDRCMTILETSGDALFNEYIKNLKKLRTKLSELRCIHLLAVDDISKIVLITENGKALYQNLLENYHVQLEMASLHYVIAMTSIGDTERYYERFAAALYEIDTVLYEKSKKNPEKFLIKDKSVLHIKDDICAEFMRCRPVIRMKPYDAENLPAERVRLEKSAGRTAAAGICFYPPGIPLINPGEIITSEIIKIIISGLEKNLEVIGVETGKKEKGIYILCLK